MRVPARLRDGLGTFGVLAVPVAVVAVGFPSGPGSDPLPGEGRMAHHIRICKECGAEDSYAECLACLGFAALIAEIQADTERMCNWPARPEKPAVPGQRD